MPPPTPPERNPVHVLIQPRGQTIFFAEQAHKMQSENEASLDIEAREQLPPNLLICKASAVR